MVSFFLFFLGSILHVRLLNIPICSLSLSYTRTHTHTHVDQIWRVCSFDPVFMTAHLFYWKYVGSQLMVSVGFFCQKDFDTFDGETQIIFISFAISYAVLLSLYLQTTITWASENLTCYIFLSSSQRSIKVTWWQLSCRTRETRWPPFSSCSRSSRASRAGTRTRHRISCTRLRQFHLHYLLSHHFRVKNHFNRQLH